jgi:hypothetical protein
MLSQILAYISIRRAPARRSCTEHYYSAGRQICSILAYKTKTFNKHAKTELLAPVLHYIELQMESK